MATLKKASSYFHYLLALLIAGMFSLVGKPSPSWASGIFQNHNATVFKERYRVAENTAPTTTEDTTRPVFKQFPMSPNPCEQTSLEMEKNLSNGFYMQSGAMHNFLGSTEVNQKIHNTLTQIKEKLISTGNLSIAELNFLKMMDLSFEIERINNKLNVLTNQICEEKPQQ